MADILSPKDWLTKRKNKQVNSGSKLRTGLARRAQGGTPSMFASARKFTAGQGVTAKKVNPTIKREEIISPSSHVTPTRMVGANTAQQSPGDYDKSKAIEKTTEVVPIDNPTKSGLAKLASKAKKPFRSLAKKMAGAKFSRATSFNG